MATRSRGPSAGFDWLNRGITVGFRHPKPLFIGAFFVLLAAFMPSLITLPMQMGAMHAGTPLQPVAFGWMTALSVLLALLILPLYAGYLNLVDSVENGRIASAGDIFKPYRDGRALRVIGYGIVMLVIYFAIFAAIIATTGKGLAHWYLQALTAQANHQPPPTELPDGFGVTVSSFVVIAILMASIHAIGLGQVTFRNRGVFGAIGDGAVGTLKNLLPLLMLALGYVLVAIAVLIGIAIFIFILALVGKLIGAWIMLALIIPFYIAFFLIGFTAMFGVMYQLWRDICDDDTTAGLAEPIAA